MQATRPVRDYSKVGDAIPIPDLLYFFLKEKTRTCPFVFTNSEGRPWNVDSLNSAMQRFRKTYRKTLGFDFDFKKLRRTYGSILYERGLSLDQIGHFLGHSDLRTTKKWYCGLRAGDFLERVSQAFSFSPTPAETVTSA